MADQWKKGERLSIWQDGQKVAAVVCRDLDRPTAEEVRRANMIAAAPELLEALEACAAMFKLVRFDSDRDPTFAEAARLTRAALSKATA